MIEETLRIFQNRLQTCQNGSGMISQPVDSCQVNTDVSPLQFSQIQYKRI